MKTEARLTQIGLRATTIEDIVVISFGDFFYCGKLQLYCVTREAPALFHLATGARGFKECPILPKTEKDLAFVIAPEMSFARKAFSSFFFSGFCLYWSGHIRFVFLDLQAYDTFVGPLRCIKVSELHHSNSKRVHEERYAEATDWLRSWSNSLSHSCVLVLTLCVLLFATCLVMPIPYPAIAAAEEEADNLLAILRHQAQQHVPKAWLQQQVGKQSRYHFSDH